MHLLSQNHKQLTIKLTEIPKNFKPEIWCIEMGSICTAHMIVEAKFTQEDFDVKPNPIKFNLRYF